MKVRFGYEIVYSCPQSMSMVFMLHAQTSPSQRLLVSDTMSVYPYQPLISYRDSYGNLCTRLEAPAGSLCVTADGLMEDSGVAEPAYLFAQETAVSALPHEALMYLLPCRYCESDLLGSEAIQRFGHLAPGWSRVQAVCDFVHNHVTFGYGYARPTKTAMEAFNERTGVCRDFAHLAIALCRALNIPARYVTGYLGDIGVPPVQAPMDFAGSIEVYLQGAWHAFDPRNNARRIGRLVIARGRDAADVAISTAFGQPLLQSFKVWTDEVPSSMASNLQQKRVEALSDCAA